MKPLFTVHAGEFLVGCEIEKRFRRVNVWLPGKDTGIDLLVSNKDNAKTVSIQVKFSRDYLVTHIKDPLVLKNLRACGWWTPTQEQIKHSRAQYWVFVLLGFFRNTEFIIIKPTDLWNRLIAIHGRGAKKFHIYLWVTQKGKCFETRALNRYEQQVLTLEGKVENHKRDFSAYLDNWAPIKALNS